jgi:hypothetical protein
VVGNHALGVYERGAAAVDASDHPSLTESVEQMREDGFLGNDSSSTESFTITMKR